MKENTTRELMRHSGSGKTHGSPKNCFTILTSSLRRPPASPQLLTRNCLRKGEGDPVMAFFLWRIFFVDVEASHIVASRTGLCTLF